MGGCLLKVYFSVYQTANARCKKETFGWDRSFVCSMTIFGWSASQEFTSASRVVNPVFRLLDCKENSFIFTVCLRRLGRFTLVRRAPTLHNGTYAAWVAGGQNRLVKFSTAVRRFELVAEDLSSWRRC